MATKKDTEIRPLKPAKRAAAERGLAYTSLRDCVFRGELPVVRIGRAWYFDDADLDRFIETRKEILA